MSTQGDDKMRISVIDWIGEFKGGVGVILSFVVGEHVFEGIFWTNPEGKFTLTMEEDFHLAFGIENIYTYEGTPRLLAMINEVLPSREKMFREFNVGVDGEV